MPGPKKRPPGRKKRTNGKKKGFGSESVGLFLTDKGPPYESTSHPFEGVDNTKKNTVKFFQKPGETKGAAATGKAMAKGPEEKCGALLR